MVLDGTSARLRRSDLAPPERTLIDVLEATAAAFPEEPAIDAANTVLTYRDLIAAVENLAGDMRAAGVKRGDRVGIRMASGSADLYVAILATLRIGAAYVPVDADDPPERAALVFGEAAVAATVTDGPTIEGWTTADPTGEGWTTEGSTTADPTGEGSTTTDPTGEGPTGQGGDAGTTSEGSLERPGLTDDAWIIFTSGSTGVPKGVAVTHRSAAAFVDAEANLFLIDSADPLGPGDRVLAGLSVAFDASCEEMWLAWRHGACLVPAPRSLVRSGMDLGPWLLNRRITVVSTVPTLASLWPSDALDNVRLLIFGGEACPPTLVERLAGDDRELWNTYGPTEATVVACAAPLVPGEAVRIGLPLDGWDLAVVDGDGQPVAVGETGELVIGGVGLARYLDAERATQQYAPMPSLGWDRAYRSGDLVINDPDGLIFAGRADDQIKIGGRRIELGEIDAALNDLPGVTAAAGAVRTTGAGQRILAGYVAGEDLDLRALTDHLRTVLSSPLVPVLVACDEIPVRTSGKADRDALPWPPPTTRTVAPGPALTEPLASLAEQWRAVLGVAVDRPDDDFFDLGGGSLPAAKLVSVLRDENPQVTVGDIYAFPRLAAMAERLAELATDEQEADRPWVRRTPRRAQGLQVLLSLVIQTIVGARWLVWLCTLVWLLGLDGDSAWVPSVSWPWLLAGWVALVSPFGRMAIAAIGCRILMRGVGPGVYPRGGKVHIRLWAAEQLGAAAGAANLAGAP